MLSRITWPEVHLSEVLEKISETKADRICIQAVKNNQASTEVFGVLNQIKSVTDVPVSISMSIETEGDVKKLFDAGADIVSIALDCASEKLSSSIKSISFPETKELILKLSTRYPKKITTHLIAGLGETDKELIELSKELVAGNVNVSLFAFTPIPGTKLQNQSQPSVERYRKLQVAMATLRKNTKHIFEFDENDMLISVKSFASEAVPADFQTPGCTGCNRPYYNERPGGEIYNYPNPPDIEEVLKEIK
ncbi:MAG: radical SAM protein [Caldisericia bacterium]